MIKLTKNICVILLLFFLSNSLYSLNHGISISLEPIFSIKDGYLHEYVYAFDSTSNSEVKMSQLDWKMKMIPTLGTKIGFSWKFISIEGIYTGAIPKRSGTMCDYDWLDYTGGGPYYYNDAEMCTTKSINENTLDYSHFLEGTLKAKYSPVNGLFINPFFSANINTTKFSASNGYGWYGQYNKNPVPYDSDEAIFYDKGSLHGIEYTIEHINFNLGLEINYDLNSTASFFISGYLSPYSFAGDLDFHHSNKAGTEGKYYCDQMEGLFKRYNLTIGSRINLPKNLYLSFVFDYNWLNQLKGETYISYEPNFYADNRSKYTTARCSGEWLDFSISLKKQF